MSDTNPNTNPKKVIFNKYEVGKLLGCGAFAKVYHGRELTSNLSVAIKVIPNSRLTGSKAHQQFSRHIACEVNILGRLRHPNIIRLHEVLASRSKIFLVLDFANGGELFSRIRNLGRLPEHLCRKFTHQLISAVGYFNSRGVFHRDLKPENLLLDENLNLKITDFGLSAIVYGRQTGGADDPNSTLLHTLCGTPGYVAPEILAKKGYRGDRVAVWSCGIILFVMCMGYLPFNEPNLRNMYIKMHFRDFRIPRWVSPELRRLITRMLDPNPETRITVDDIVKYAWFRRDLDVERWMAEMKFGSEGQVEEKEEEEEMREMNAFDLISMSSGLSLSGLFEERKEKERFVSDDGVMERVEMVGRREGWYVKRRGETSVVVRGREGRLVVRIRVYRLRGDMVVVEVEKGGESWVQEAWNEMLAPVLRGDRVDDDCSSSTSENVERIESESDSENLQLSLLSVPERTGVNRAGDDKDDEGCNSFLKFLIRGVFLCG